MDQLNSIDLTQGKRFERVLRDINTSRNNVITDRGIHRLKKGEIPSITNNNGYITISSHTIDTIITEWVVLDDPITAANNLDRQIISNITTTDLGWNVSVGTTTTTSDLITWTTNSSPWIINSTDNGGIISSFTNYTLKSNYGYKYDYTDISDKPITDRIGYDPFEMGEVVHHNDDILYRFKNYEYDNTPRILKRLLDNDRSYMDENAIDRLEIRGEGYDNLHDLMGDVFNIYGVEKPRERDTTYLKKVAPFISRVYRTNQGRSFDNTELKFDMVLAQEHFDAAIQ